MTTNEDNTLIWRFTPRQQVMLGLLSLDNTDVEEVLFGGAKGGGKSVGGGRWALMHSDELIERYDLPYTDHPPVAGFLGRKRGVDFNDTTLETIKREWPPDRYVIKEQAKEIIVRGRIKLLFGGFDNVETINKFNSAEFSFAFIDQAEELTINDVGMLRGAMRGKLKDQVVPRKILWTANPRRGWLKEQFIDKRLVA